MADDNPTDDKTPVGRPNIYVQSLTFNDGTTLPVNKNDIVVFVGPNNVGKSQALKDIQSKALSNDPTVIFDTVNYSSDPHFSYQKWLDSIAVKRKDQYGNYEYGEMNVKIPRSFLNAFRKSKILSRLSELLICLLKTEDRLTIADPPENINLDMPALHPIHLLCRNSAFRKKVSERFEEAFDVPIIPFKQFGNTTPLILGTFPVLSQALTDEIEREEIVSSILSQYPHLENQGDGMRSFVGLMLYLIIDHYNTFLIDEPESFLHPPQARLMGKTVGDLLSNEQQAFISTHSIHFIQGLLEKCPERVKVVRITRTGDKNTFSILDQTRILELSKDPFLKYSNLLEGLFYKNVVLCEADADCMFYSMVNGAPDMKGPKASDTLFIHCGGKHRMAAVARDLRALHIDFRVIPDFDIFNDKNTLRNLVEACGGVWSKFDPDYIILLKDIQKRAKTDMSGQDLINRISSIVDLNAPLSKNQKKAIRELLDGVKSEWDRLKETGITGVSSGETSKACDALLKSMKTIGIHVVPCGELERFVPGCKEHGPLWIQKVLDNHRDLSDPVFAEAKGFVRTWNL